MLGDYLSGAGTRAISPDAPTEIIAEIGSSPSLARYKEELIHGQMAEQALAILRQRKLKAANDAVPQFHTVFGRKIASIDPEHYYRMRMLYGPQCWRDKEFLRDTLEKNPEMRVNTTSRKTTIVMSGQISDVRRQTSAETRRAPGHVAQGEPAKPMVIATPNSGHETAGAPPVFTEDNYSPREEYDLRTTRPGYAAA